MLSVYCKFNLELTRYLISVIAVSQWNENVQIHENVQFKEAGKMEPLKNEKYISYISPCRSTYQRKL